MFAAEKTDDSPHADPDASLHADRAPNAPLARPSSAPFAGSASSYAWPPEFPDTPQRTLHVQELIDFAPVGYIVTDRFGAVKEANHKAAKLLNVAPGFLIDKPLGLFVLSEDSRHFYQLLVELGTKRFLERRSYEFRVGRGRESAVCLEAAVEVLPEGESGDRCYRWLVRDASARVVADLDILAEKTFADALLEIIPSYVMVLNREGRVVRANAWAQSCLSAGGASLEGIPWSSFLPPDDQLQAELVVWQSSQRMPVDGLRTGLKLANGSRRAVSWHVRAHANIQGQPMILLVGHDITDLEEAQAQAVRSERLAAVGEFVTMLAHESRNALQRSQACLERLSWRLKGEPDALDLVRRAQSAQTELTRLLDDIRAFTNPAPRASQQCDLADIWREAWQQVITVHSAPAALRETATDADLHCRGDRFRLIQVFRNLFENSLDAGADCVQIEAQKENKPARLLRIRVLDNGQGFPTSERERVFDPFFTTKAHGSGLGMSICRRIMRAHGGEIAIEGMGNAKGAEVVLTLPEGES
jgi:two-component system sensor kinase FixL